jgi:hypothetical protein
MTNVTFRTHIEGPRWANARQFLLDTAYKLDLDIKTEVIKGWFTERIYFTVTGSDSNVDRFKRQVQQALLQYNNA